MKRQTSSSSSKNSNRKTKYTVNPKNKSVLKIKWQSPNDKKQNEINFISDPKEKDFIQIKDNH